jgi:hypothetical protein
MTTGHPSGLADHHIAHFLPTRGDTWPTGNQLKGVPAFAPVSATPISIFSHQLSLLAISRALHGAYLEFAVTGGEDALQGAFLAQKFAVCADDLDEWPATLPQSLQAMLNNVGLRLRSPAASSLMMMQAYYHALVVFLHGLAAHPPSSALASQLAAYQITSRDKCARSVDSLVQLASAGDGGHLDKLGWPFGWAIWVAARYILIAEHGGSSPFPPEHFNTLLRSLAESTRYWQVSGKYWWLLRQARNERQSCGIFSNSGVLRFLLDQRVATSDLEDRFRCDHFFSDASRAQDRDMQQAGGELQPRPQLPQGPLVSFAGGEVDHLLLNDMDFVFPGESTEAWFSGPLNAASAYQPRYPALLVDAVSLEG